MFRKLYGYKAYTRQAVQRKITKRQKSKSEINNGIKTKRNFTPKKTKTTTNSLHLCVVLSKKDRKNGNKL